MTKYGKHVKNMLNQHIKQRINETKQKKRRPYFLKTLLVDFDFLQVIQIAISTDTGQ